MKSIHAKSTPYTAGSPKATMPKAKKNKPTPHHTFLEKLLFGPHLIEGQAINEEEDELVMQQLAWWCRME